MSRVDTVGAMRRVFTHKQDSVIRVQYIYKRKGGQESEMTECKGMMCIYKNE